MKPAAPMPMVIALFLAAGAQGASIINSKHDLSAGSSSTGPKASAESQRCIFCHTPHRAGRNVPLWNHTLTSQPFTFYSSNYVNSYLGMPTPSVPKFNASRTKLCLSCHDGLTALGSVYNTGAGPGTIGMNATPLGAAANLGTSLADDHPVLYDVIPGAGAGQDPEIVLPPGGDKVKVYPPSNTVECVSCHDPHDNQYPPFLVKSNANAAICTTCHNKTGYSASVHATSGAAYTPPGGSATTVGEWSCRSCHRAHGANVTAGQAYILRGAEENTCFACHGSPPLAGTSNIQTEMGKASRHPTTTLSGLHINPEVDGSNFTTAPNRRHAECQDCHNPHRVQAGTSSGRNPSSNAIPNALLGAWGVSPTYGGAAWTTPISWLRRVFTDTTFKEYELCFKCHSSYAFGASPPAGGTDVAREFNPLNASWHPVYQAGNNPYCVSSATNGNNLTMEFPYNQVANQHDPIMCSDCHGSDAAAPMGPHGSTQTRILKASLVDATAAGTPLCIRCHKASSYNTGNTGSRFGNHTRNAHRAASGNSFAGSYGGCLNCHGNYNSNTGTGTGNFHGLNDQWAACGGCGTAAGPALRFIANKTSMAGWQPGRCGGTGIAGCAMGNQNY